MWIFVCPRQWTALLHRLCYIVIVISVRVSITPRTTSSNIFSSTLIFMHATNLNFGLDPRTSQSQSKLSNDIGKYHYASECSDSRISQILSLFVFAAVRNLRLIFIKFETWIAYELGKITCFLRKITEVNNAHKFLEFQVFSFIFSLRNLASNRIKRDKTLKCLRKAAVVFLWCAQ